MGGIALKASVLIRPIRGGQLPPASFAAILLPARAALRRDVERAFAQQRDPVTGRAWVKRKGAYPHAPLVKTGTMRAAALVATDSARVTGSSLTVSVPTPKYATYQQKGTRTIAPRRFLGASIGTVAVVRAGLIRAGREHIVRVLRGRK